MAGIFFILRMALPIFYIILLKRKDLNMFNLSKIPQDNPYDEEIENNESFWTTNNVHDPAIFKDGDWYYVFSTDAQVGGTFKPGIQIRKSRDLVNWQRSEEHTSELQSRGHLVCRLLLEKKT